MKDSGSKAEIELSVIIPVYNVEQYLERCINSIRFQDYRVDEIICVDDGSTDGSLEVLQKIANIDDRVRILQKENGGLVSARKEGLNLARGRYVACVDADDWIEKNMYQEMMEVMLRTDSDIVTSGSIRDYDGYCVEESEKIPAGTYSGDNLVQILYSNMVSADVFFESNLSIHVINKIYKRELLKTYQMKVDDRIIIGEDAACAYPCLLNAKKISVMGKNYYHYCMRNNSLMGVSDCNEYEKMQLLFDYLYKEFQSKQEIIPNIMKQFYNIKYYMLMLRYADKVLYYREGILFPFGKVSKSDKVVIYGAGRFGVQLIEWLKKNDCCNIAAWVDKAKGGSNGIEGIDFLKTNNYDKIIIAVALNDIVEKIRRELLEMGIEENIIYTIDCNMLVK